MEIRVLRLFILIAVFSYSVNASLPIPASWSSGHQSAHDQRSMLAHLADMQVLLEFKLQVQQDPHGIMATWMPSSDSSSSTYRGACSWHGVSCSPSQRVVKLELRDADLEGPLMLSTLMAMDMLELLDLSGNRFHGNLTSGVFHTASGDCGNLQTVILGNNMIHGSIPSDLLACGTIQKLDLSHADLTGTLPPTFFLKCGSLELLDLSHNHLTGRLPNAINSCAHLQKLNLSFNSLSGELPSDILAASSSCEYINDRSCNRPSSLQVLDLTSNNLTGPIPDSVFQDCGSVVSLNLSRNAFSAEIPRSLQKCAALEELNFSENRFDSLLPASLGELGSIRALDLSSNHLTGSIPNELTYACATLKHLQLSANNISGTIPSSFRACASLQTLSLAKNQLSGSFPGEIVSHFKVLEVLDLGFNRFTGPFPSQITNCSNLKVLDLSSNRLTGNIPPQVCPPSSSTLETLLLANNKFGGEVPSSLANCSQLIVLDLSFNQLDGAIPQELGLISGLESLLLWSNKLIGEIPKELGSLSQLKSLVLNNNLLFGTIPLELSNCSAIEWICLSSNRLTGTIPTFLGAMQHLTILELGNNSLSGHVPPELANATKFIWVDLNSNYLEGPIPSGLGRHPYGINVTRLHYEFAFVRNLGYKCRGLGILLEFGGITQAALSLTPLRSACNVTRLYVEDSLNGDSDFSSIQYLDLSYNMLEGNIPEDMGYLTALQMLSLGHNQLVGPIPASFSHLRSIGVLDLSYNKLEGGVWPLANCSFLVQIDVSNNNLSGNIPTTGQLSTAPIAGFLNNSGLCGEPLPPCGSSSISSSDRCRHGACLAHDRMGVLSWANSIVLGILIAVAFMCMLIVWGLMMRSKRAEKQKDASGLHLPSCQGLNSSTTWNIGGEREPLSINVATFERPLRKLTFAQLIEATNGFSQESLIGVGGFGEVYKAELQDGSVVAIKKLLQSSYQGDREFIAEMETLGKIKHKNLVPLLGYCKVGEERLLVYEYMDGGSLEDMLHAGVEEGDRTSQKDREKLTWDKRKQIAKGAARGLAFLHHNCIPHIIHRDMKSSNVLLDKNLEARVSDFGMARLISALDTHLSVSTLAGTPGYVPPEYCQSFRCTTKGDVYSFGVVLLELLTGRRPTNLVITTTSSATTAASAEPPTINYKGQVELLADVNLVGWVRSHVAAKRALHALDARLLRASSSASTADHLQMLQYLRLACDCVEDLPHRRPSMQHVLTMMKELEVAL